MNVKDATAYLTSKGYRCSVATVRALVKAGRLRCYRPGVGRQGRMEFTEAQLDDFLRGAEQGGPVEPEKPKAGHKATPRPPARPAGDWRSEYDKVKGA